MVDDLSNSARSNRRNGALLACVLAVSILGLGSIGSSAQTTGADLAAKMAALREAGSGLIPLFALGDVNEDGRVDEADLALLREMVRAGGEAQPSAAVSCPAAGDVDENGRIDNRDLATLSEWVTRKVTAPALAYQAVLPCKFKRSIVAASPSAKSGGTAHFRFLDAGLTVANTQVKIEEGNAVVGDASDGRGYDIIVLATAKTGDQIVLKIVLPDASMYYYSLPVEDAYQSGLTDDAAKLLTAG